MSDDCPNGSENCHFRCPSGGTWYTCPDEPYFVGCCSSDPCTNTQHVKNASNVCPDVYAATFDQSLFDEIRPNSCIGSANTNWYTCNATEPPFLGCCGVNPCKEGKCPKKELLPAAWSSTRGDQFELFDDRGANDDDVTGSEDGGLSGGAIAGIVVGAVVGVLILLGIGWWIWRKRRDTKGTYTAAGHTRGPSNMSEDGEYGYMHPASSYQDSHFSSPNPTAPSTAKYTSGSSGFSPSLSPPMPSESGRPISEISGDDHYHRATNHGLGVFGTKPEPIQELDSTSRPEIHELDASR
ncbi:hypothetical protein BDV18DRAFT_155665 [Aspergillus unguis]